MIRSFKLPANGLEFDTLAAGSDDRPLVLFLHGFPEHAGAWTLLLSAMGNTYLAVAPNQRGYGRSSKPLGVEQYRVQLLAKDVLEVASALSPDRKFHLVAHDWGASVGYMVSFMAPQRIASFTVLNGVHPIPFQRALIHDAAQRAASQYMRFLRQDDAAAILSANTFQVLLGMLARGFDGGRWMTEDMKRGYLDAWSQPGAMEAMVSWYKATPLSVPLPDEPVADNAMSTIDPSLVRVRMPHQVIWGMKDTALLPVSRQGLAEFCDDLIVHEIADADHWIVHQKLDEVTAHLTAFIGKHAS